MSKVTAGSSAGAVDRALASGEDEEVVEKRAGETTRERAAGDAPEPELGAVVED